MSLIRRQWLMRLAFRAYLVLLCVLCVVAFFSLMQGNFLQAAVAVAVILADFAGLAAVAVGLVACLLVGAYLAALLAAAMVLTRLLGRRRGLLGGDHSVAFDPEALAAATSFPGPLRERLGEVAGGGPITTRSMLALAAGREPATWKRLLGRDPGESAFDGPLLRGADGSECSQYAAEALGLARATSERLARPLDPELLAASAVFIPLSAASDWMEPQEVPAELARVSSAQLVAAASAFSADPAGADFLRRVEVVTQVGARGEGAQREQMAALQPGFLAKVAGLSMGATVIATVAAIFAVAGELLLDLLRWLLSLPRRALGLPARAWRLVLSRPGRRLGRRWRRLTVPWAAWPSLARPLWLGGRPLLGLAAAVCIVGFGSLSVWLALPLALAAVAVRSVRWPWLPLVAAAAVATISPAGAALLALRILLGEAIIWRLGWEEGWRAARRQGLRAVIAARRDAAGRLSGYPAESLVTARAAFASAVGGSDEDAVMERATAYAVATWAAWRWPELLRLARLVARGLLRGQWTGPIEEAGMFDREIASLSLLDDLLEFLGRWGVLLVAAAAAFLTAGPGGLVGGDDLVGRCVAAAATVLIAAPLTRRRIEFTVAAFWVAIAWIALGSHVWEPIAIAIAAGLTTRSLRRVTETLSLAGRARWRSWPAPRWRPRRLRRHWQAASSAIDAGDERLGVEMLKELAEEAASDETFFAAALGRAALVEVDLGRLQAAVAHLDEISAKSGEPRGIAAVAAGMLAGALGDFERAAQLLRPALEDLDSSSPLVPRATLALAEALARGGEPDAALELIAGHGSRPFALRGLAATVEAQVAIAAALAERDRESGEDGERAVEMLSRFADFADPEDLELQAMMSADAIRDLQRAQAQLLTLYGQLLLARRPGEATGHLERAVALATEASEEALKARAQILHGSALARGGGREQGTSRIVRGVEVLESRRVQLRDAERRTAMIGAGEQLYSAALGGFLAAQGKGCEKAGMEAAKLIESLRQSALAATLRAGSLPLDPDTERLIEQVLAGERVGADVEALRAVVGEQVSARFAAAYLPTAVSSGRLRDACRGFDHVLVFHVPPGGLPGWRVWITPDGEAEVDQIGTDPGPLLAALAATGKLPDEQIHLPLSQSSESWERLGEELLPQGMRKALLGAGSEQPPRILLVPDGVLALVPWAALRIGGRSLVESAVVQAVPALELAGSTGRGAATERVLAHLPSAVDGAELAALRECSGVEIVTSRDAFLGALGSNRFDGVYMASHGHELGLRQRVEFADGSSLSAASALACDWPAWTVFSSCLVGRVEQVAGREPFGLAISCMLRGADTILASVVELADEGALACGEATAGLATAGDPAEALRAAQLRQLERRSLTSLADGLGLVCISTRAPGAG